jgi:hypothetical protein
VKFTAFVYASCAFKRKMHSRALLGGNKKARRYHAWIQIPCFSLRSSEIFFLIKSLPRQNQDKMETGKGFVSFSRSCSSNIIEATASKSSQSKEL